MLLAVDISETLNEFFTTLFTWLPRVVGFLAVLIIGYFVAKIVGNLVARVLERIGLDRWVHRGFGGSWIERVIQHPSRLLGTITFWVIFLAVISIAVDVLGIDALQDAVRAVWSYVPNLLAALLIFLVASAIAAAVVTLVTRTMGDTATGRIVRAVAPVLIMGIAVFMILDELEIAESIVVITYAALMGAIALGMALAFGLGGRDVASQMLQGAYAAGQRSVPQVRQDVQQGRARAEQEAERLRDKTEESSPADPPPPEPPPNLP